MKKHKLLFLLLSMSCLMLAQPRHRQTINEVWQFHKGEVTDGAMPGLDDSRWEVVDIPHTWNIADIEDDPYGWYRGIGWYRKHLRVEPRMKGKRLYLCFEAANQVSAVYVNGKPAGREHIGGYTPFAYEITGLVNEGGDNVVAVRVDNAYNEEIAPLLADYVFFGGIYRDVYLLETGQTHFDVLNSGTGVFIRTPHVSTDKGTVEIRADISMGAIDGKPVTMTHTVIGRDRKPVASVSEKVKAKTGEKVTVAAKSLTIKCPALWSPDDPYLYAVVSELKDAAGVVLDKVENPLGFRWFRFDSDRGFFLNGKPLKLIGTNRHQDYVGYGNALTDDMHRYDMQMIKDLGTNCLRISHYPHDPSVLEMCDRMGLIAFEEIPIIDYITQSEEYLENCKSQISEMIRRDYNHPCIVAWNGSNESTVMRPPKMIDNDNARYERDLAHFFKALDEHIRKEDDSRYTMIVHCGDARHNKDAGFHVADLIGYNKYEGWYENDYQNIWNVLRSFKTIDPQHPFFLTEYGAGADYRVRTFEPRKFDHSVEYQVLYNKEHLDAVYGLDFISGSTIWNLADFYSEGRGETQPHINNKGLLTLDRRPKDSFYYFKTRLSKEPYAVIPSKIWTSRGGREDGDGVSTCTQPVEIFANTPEVELFLNGRSLGVKAVEQYCATFDVPFTDGENRLELKSDQGRITDFLKINFQLQPYNLKSDKMLFKELAINVGSHFYFIDDTKNNYIWLPDQPYQKGSWGYTSGERYIRDLKNGLVGSRNNITGTTAEPLFQTQIVGLPAYRVDVPEGNYEVTLLFSELMNDSTRVFDVHVNDRPVMQGLNLYKRYGANRAISKRFEATVENDEGLTVLFSAVQGLPVLNGIVIRKIY